MGRKKAMAPGREEELNRARWLLPSLFPAGADYFELRMKGIFEWRLWLL